MNIRHLSYLNLIIQEKSHAAAARVAGVSQPAVTKAMQSLEAATGITLFKTVAGRSVPTAAAHVLAQQGCAFEATLAGLRARVPVERSGRPARGLRNMNVGLSSGAALLYGALLARGWESEKGPKAPLRIVNGNSPDLLAALRVGSLDLVITPRPRGGSLADLRETYLFESVPAIYARVNHRLGTAQALGDLAGVRWIVVGSQGTPGNMIEEAHHVRGLKPPQVLVQCQNYMILLQLVAETDLMGVLPHSVLGDNFFQDKVRALHIREGLPRYDVCLYVRAGTQGYRSASVKRMAEALRETCYQP